MSWESWLLKEAREKEYIESARCSPLGLKYDCVFEEEVIEAGGESLGGGGGGTDSSNCSSFRFVSSTYFSKSVRVSSVLLLGKGSNAGSGSARSGAGAASATDMDVGGELLCASGPGNGGCAAARTECSGPSTTASAYSDPCPSASEISRRRSWLGNSRVLDALRFGVCVVAGDVFVVPFHA